MKIRVMGWIMQIVLLPGRYEEMRETQSPLPSLPGENKERIWTLFS